MRALLAAVSLLSVATNRGCAERTDPCFPPASAVADLRVLAIRADPPEALLDEAGDAPELTVSTLIVMPEEQPKEVKLSAWLCVPVAGGLCDAALAPIFAGVYHPRDTLKIRVGRDLIGAAKAADPVGGLRGFHVQLQLQANVEFQAPAVATKQLVFWPADSGHVPNQAIEVAGLVLREPANSTAVLVGHSLQVDIGIAVNLRPLVPPGSAEVVQLPALGGGTIQTVERVTWSFFGPDWIFFGRPHLLATGSVGFGVYDGTQADVADEPPPGTPEPPYGLVEITGLSSQDPTDHSHPNPRTRTGRFWIVVSDGRGGVAWDEYILTVNEIRKICLFEPYKCAELLVGCG